MSHGGRTLTISRRPETSTSAWRLAIPSITVDPGDHVDNEAHTAPWRSSKTSSKPCPGIRCLTLHQGCTSAIWVLRFEVEDLILAFDETALARAAAKYGRAIAHTVRMYQPPGRQD